jgi:hypothetical protein
MVTLYIGIADYEWFRYLSAREDRTGLDALLKAVARREIGSLQWSNGARIGHRFWAAAATTIQSD